MTLEDRMQNLKNPDRDCPWELQKYGNRPTRRPQPQSDISDEDVTKSQICVLVSEEIHHPLDNVDNSTKFVGCSLRTGCPAKVSRDRWLEKDNSRSPDREQNTYEQSTSSRANDRLNIWYLRLGHWVVVMATTSATRGLFKWAMEILSGGCHTADNRQITQQRFVSFCQLHFNLVNRVLCVPSTHQQSCQCPNFSL